MLRIVFTDLDGTLLDHHTYDYSAALPALASLKEKQIPLVFCSSKTAAEMIPFRAALENEDPFIVENGGGIYIPKGYFATLPAEARRSDDFFVIPQGIPYVELEEILARISRESGLAIQSFAELTASQLAEDSGLSLEEAQRALQREFDLPFRILGPHPDRTQLEEKVQQLGLKLVQGGRFLHLSGNGEKGDAVSRLVSLYQTNREGPIQSIALGDSQNDLCMLRAVDIPIVIPNPDSVGALTDELPDARQAHTSGPRGWNEVVLSLLDHEFVENRKLNG